MATALDLFRNWYLPALREAKIYAKWRTDNPGEAQLFDAYVDAVLAGKNPAPPILKSPIGRSFIVAGQMAALPPQTVEKIVYVEKEVEKIVYKDSPMHVTADRPPATTDKQKVGVQWTDTKGRDAYVFVGESATKRITP